MKNINISLSSDTWYAWYLTTTIYSILYNINKKVFVNFYILSDNINWFTKEKILSSLENFNNYKINFIDIQNNDFNDFPTTERLTKASYLRILLPELLSNLDKVIYLDCDLIINYNITDLWDMPFDGFPIIASRVPDLFYAYYCKYKYNIKKNNNLFNSWVLVMDLNFFRKNNISKKIISFLNETWWWDQDAFNYIFSENYKELNYLWNYCFISSLKLSSFSKNDIKEIKWCTPKIIHFAWALKPLEVWKIYLLSKYYRMFFFFYHKTEFWKNYNLPIIGKLNLKINIIIQYFLKTIFPRKILLYIFWKYYTLTYNQKNEKNISL